MPKAVTDNTSGHRAKYDHLMQHLPTEEAGETFVGGGDPVLVGLRELEAIRAYASTDGAVIIDIGCGIGRLTQHMLYESIRHYVGLDIIPEILRDAEAKAKGDARFRFALSTDCIIPEPDRSADIVVGFSVITHLLDEESFDYFREANRVLKVGGIGIFSFLDFNNARHQEMFFKHAMHHRHGHGDILKFTTQDVLRLFGERSGFRIIEFVDDSSEWELSRIPSRLIDVETLPPRYQLGQSLCVLRN